ncbi:flagellar hook-length control protein FliK [bacterium SCSIO 12696]|nr:flagellar hook-length control protein FliK [bacterium SCSIO 12696]
MLGEITLTGLNSQGAISNQLHNWRVGQILEAVVLSRSASERLQIRIGNAQLEARSQAPIQAGDRVLLKVLSAGTSPTLQVVPAAVPSGASAELVNQALRQLLPRQLPTERVLNNLLDILQGRSLQRGESLPVRTQGLIETVLSRIPRGEKLADSARLQQLVLESGLFHEQGKQRPNSGSGQDIKQALVQLAKELARQRPSSSENNVGRVTTAPPASTSQGVPSAGGVASNLANATPATPLPATVQPPKSAATGVASRSESHGQQGIKPLPQVPVPAKPGGADVIQGRETPGASASSSAIWNTQDLQRLVEGGIARIVSQQIQSLPQQGQDGARWVLELPYLQGDEYRSLPMVIEREASRDDRADNESGWQVELGFELPELGLVEATLLVRGDKVSVSLWLERANTAQLAEAELPVLEAALQANDLEIGALICRKGKSPSEVHTGGISTLLDCHI